jgi:hypothetical protein
MSFQLTDVRKDETVLRGTSNTWGTIEGRVTEILPGIGFRVRGTNNQEAIIWRDYTLVEAAEATGAMDPPLQPSPNDIGYPDCEFWAANGVEPLYVASPYHYSAGSMRIPPPGSLFHPLMAHREKAERLGGAHLQAWTRQIADCMTLMPDCSPRRSDSDSAAPAAAAPDAPVKEALHIVSPASPASVTVCKKLFTEAEDCSDCCGCDDEQKDGDADVGDKGSEGKADEDADDEDEEGDEDADDEDEDADDEGDEEGDDEDEEDDDDADDKGYYGDRAKYMAICDFLTTTVSVPIVAVLAAALLPMILSSSPKPCLC